MTPSEARTLQVLSAKREHLATLAQDRADGRLVELLRRVDAALGAVEVGDWGLCAVCRDPFTPATLRQDPLRSVCLECLSPPERQALQRDLHAAARTQHALLPPAALAWQGWELAYLWEPRGVVSGDHVDLIVSEAPESPLHLLLGDVAGKGVAASLLQAHLHALFRALVPQGPSLGGLVEKANRLFADATSAASYATLLALRLEVCGDLSLVNAGHPRPLLADARGVRPVEGGDLPLELFAGSAYKEHSLHLEPGQTLVLYTDGWTEGAVEDEEFGIGRAAAALRRAGSLPLPELLHACRADLEAFLGGAPKGDDLTLVALRRAAGCGVQ